VKRKIQLLRKEGVKFVATRVHASHLYTFHDDDNDGEIERESTNVHKMETPTKSHVPSRRLDGDVDDIIRNEMLRIVEKRGSTKTC